MRGRGNGTHANGTPKSTKASSQPFVSPCHLSTNVRHTSARTSASQVHVHRILAPRAPQNTRRRAAGSSARTSTSAQSKAHCVRASNGVSVSQTSSDSFSMSHVSSFSLAEPESACAGRIVCTCSQSARTTASFIAELERLCGTRSASDPVGAGAGVSGEGTSSTFGSLRISRISETASSASFCTGPSSSWSSSSSSSPEHCCKPR